jgi:protein involved in polysaccharide export with SLBB domain
LRKPKEEREMGRGPKALLKELLTLGFGSLVFLAFVFPSNALEVYQIPYQRVGVEISQSQMGISSEVRSYSSREMGPQSPSLYREGSGWAQGGGSYQSQQVTPMGEYRYQQPGFSGTAPRGSFAPVQSSSGVSGQPVIKETPGDGQRTDMRTSSPKTNGLGPLMTTKKAEVERGKGELGPPPGGGKSKEIRGPYREGSRVLPDDVKESPSSSNQMEDELSVFEKYVSEQLPPPITKGKTIKQFGYDLFRQPGRYPFLSPADQPMDPSYVIGPDDEILLRIWGKVTGDYALKVDREGYIHVPGVGDIQVAGVRYGALKSHLSREIGKYFSGFELSARVGSLRSIRVFVVGKVEKPGTYELSSLSTIIHALGAAQGPSKTGSMRDVRLIRAGKTVVQLDLYDFLLRGDRTKDMVLQDGDVVFVPFVGPLVALTGMVKEPAIYELAHEKKLSQVIAMGGGITAVGYTPRVQVMRVKDNVYRVVMDLSLKEALEGQDIEVQDGDIIQVFAVDERIANAVELTGNVTRPGLYEWKRGIKVSDILSRPEDLKPDTYMEVAMVVRRKLPDYREELISFNLAEAMKGNPNENVLLEPGDTIHVFSKDEFNILPIVRITGAVWRPGEYKLRENMRISHLVNLAGGLKYFASEWGELTRVKVTQKGPVTEQIPINLFKALERDPSHDIPLLENDYLFVRTVPDWQLYRQVQITGEVRYPGVYAVKKGERLSSVIERAGGFTEKAYFKGAIFTRQSVKETQKKHYEEMIRRLEMEIASLNVETTAGPSDEKERAALVSETIRQRKELLAKLKQVEPTGRIVIRLSPLDKFKNSPWDLETEDGDALHIPEVPNSVQVLGAVYNPSAFTYEPGRNVQYYLSKAGGPTPFAATGQIYVLKVDGMAVPPNNVSHLVTWNSQAHRFEVDQFAGLHLDPGDTIIVPQDVERVPFLRGLKDVTTVLYQIAVSAGVLFTAFF